MSSSSAESNPANIPTVRHRLVPHFSVWIIVSLCISTLLYLRAVDPIGDDAILNILTLILAFLAFASVYGWFLIFSTYPRVLRITSIATIALAIGLFFTFNKIDRVSGNLIPQFRRRFAPPRDATLAKAEAKPAEDAVDLTPETNGDFPQFLGPQRSGLLSNVRLDQDWVKHPPKLVWKQSIGAGWSAFAARNGFAVTLEQRGDEELVTCYEVDSGKLRWVHAEEGRHETVLGGVGPRSTPTIHGGRVYTLTALGVLLCLDGSSGKPVWRVDLVEKFGSTRALDATLVAWGRSASPLIVDDLVVVPAGGPSDNPVSLAAFKQADGTLAWQGGNTQISYASPALATLAGVRQILSVNESSASGHNPETGEVLWETPWPGNSSQNASASQPLPIGEDQVLLSKGYQVGGQLLQLTKDDAGKILPKVVWENSRVLKTKFTNAVVSNGYAYDLSDGLLECVDLTTGERVWKGKRYGQGQILVVGDVLLVMSENSGEVVMVDAVHDAFRELGKFEAIEGQTWNNLCLSGKFLLVRNFQEAACFELQLRSEAKGDAR